MASKRTITLKINFWAALRDVMTHAMDKGQFPLAVVGALLALAIIKMPPEHSTTLLHRILDGLKTIHGASYALNAVLLAGWYFHAKWQRGSISIEMNRIGREKTQLQEKQTGRKLVSDNPKTKRGDE